MSSLTLKINKNTLSVIIHAISYFFISLGVFEIRQNLLNQVYGELVYSESFEEVFEQKLAKQQSDYNKIYISIAIKKEKEECDSLKIVCMQNVTKISPEFLVASRVIWIFNEAVFLQEI